MKVILQNDGTHKYQHNCTSNTKASRTGSPYNMFFSNPCLDHLSKVFELTIPNNVSNESYIVSSLWWDQAHFQFYLKAEINNLSVCFSGKRYSIANEQQNINFPKNGAVGLFENGDKIYFTGDRAINKSDTLSKNNTWVSIDNCTLSLPGYDYVCVFNLRAKYVGTYVADQAVNQCTGGLVLFSTDSVLKAS